MGHNYLQNLEGKEIWHCKEFGTRLNLDKKIFSLCHDVIAGGGHTGLGKITECSPENYYNALEKFAKKCEDPDFPCRKCPKCYKQKFFFHKLTFVALGTLSYCNSSCIYCREHFGSKEDVYNPVIYFKPFHDEHLFAENCFFDWGGGEPTQNPYFEEAVFWLIENGYNQRINTNAILYSESTAKALGANKAMLRISVDSGTETGFRKMKGHDEYHQVWGNIKRYAEINGEALYIKYNVCNYNSDQSELDAFLDKCKECGIKNVIIDAEISAYQSEKNAGPFYYTEKEYKAMHYLEDNARDKGFNVMISPFSFSYRPEYDENGKISLPTKYINNMDENILSNGIHLETYPTVDSLLAELKTTDRKVVIWGFGEIGEIVYKIMKQNNIKVSYVIDQDAGKQAINNESITIVLPEKFVADKDRTIVILAGMYWKQMLKVINDCKNINCKPVYLFDIHYRNYDIAEI